MKRSWEKEVSDGLCEIERRKRPITYYSFEGEVKKGDHIAGRASDQLVNLFLLMAKYHKHLEKAGKDLKSFCSINTSKKGKAKFEKSIRIAARKSTGMFSRYICNLRQAHDLWDKQYVTIRKGGWVVWIKPLRVRRLSKAWIKAIKSATA